MFEKVNPSHPDKIADRIAGALVDMAYAKQKDPKIAVEVLIGHGNCHIIAETSVSLDIEAINEAVARIAGNKVNVDYKEVPQDIHLAKNQEGEMRCGDNGIFKGMPITAEQMELSRLARLLYRMYPTDGKFIINNDRNELIICQSNADQNLHDLFKHEYASWVRINPLGDWTGGTDVDTGATNRKLGSDMGDAVTGGGLHGKDLSKADVAVNIYAHMQAQKQGKEIKMFCGIGDKAVKIEGENAVDYDEIVRSARWYIRVIGGFEKLAEWGLV